MAKIIENPKGFLVMEVTRLEMIKKLGKYGSIGVCDRCLHSPSVGYYVAVLNLWLCPDCYRKWSQHGTRYSSDIPIETKNFNNYKKIFGL